MSELTPRETELVALAAAIASNCLPCIEHHIPEARRAGLSDADIRAAVELADSVRQVPARRVLKTALAALGAEAGPVEAGGCGAVMAAARGCC